MSFCVATVQLDIGLKLWLEVTSRKSSHCETWTYLSQNVKYSSCFAIDKPLFSSPQVPVVMLNLNLMPATWGSSESAMCWGEG